MTPRGAPVRRRARAGVLLLGVICLVPLLTACTAGDRTTGEPNASADGAMAAPSGYTHQQLIFDDRFTGTKLDTTKWNEYIGAQGQRWDDNGILPAPDSGPNTPITDEAAMFAPSQVTVHDGLTLTAQRNTNRWANILPWISGVVTTEGKFSLPTNGWYVQVKARMPDTSQGMWPAIWFMPGGNWPTVNEFDGFEGGWRGGDPNSTMHSDYFSDQGQRQAAYDVDGDVSSGYHVYGFRFVPGHSITAYFDGRAVWRVTQASGITITPEPYEIILQLQVATQETADHHTVPTGATPPASMQVAEVQAYSLL
jgi:beta-glucanase (GH16 family)